VPLTRRAFAPAVVVVAVAAFATVGVKNTVTSVASAASPQNGQIAWKSFVAGGTTTWSIYAANPDGSNLHRLTHPPAGVHDDLPDWSPDGSNIIFERIFQPESNSPTVTDEIMRVDSNGRGLRQIATCTGRCLSNDDPQYSPDGRQIVFSRAMQIRGGTAVDLGIWVMDSDGTNLQQLSELSKDPLSEDHEPSWSPDGKNIVFMRLNDTARPRNKQALFIVSRNGGTPRRITPWTLNAGGPNWSPDGTRILFQSYRDCSCSQTSQVYTIQPNASRLQRLTDSGENIEPNWSPDGKKIIYAHRPSHLSTRLADLWSMNANGSNPRPLIKTNRWESEPDWGTALPSP
jgi:Tol biopolymer transport system component